MQPQGGAGAAEPGPGNLYLVWSPGCDKHLHSRRRASSPGSVTLHPSPENKPSQCAPGQPRLTQQGLQGDCSPQAWHDCGHPESREDRPLVPRASCASCASCGVRAVCLLGVPEWLAGLRRQQESWQGAAPPPWHTCAPPRPTPPMPLALLGTCHPSAACALQTCHPAQTKSAGSHPALYPLRENTWMMEPSPLPAPGGREQPKQDRLI